jgi:hypothetical protein
VSRFVEDALARAGLRSVLAQKRAGDVDGLTRTLATWRNADLLVLGALADLARQDEIGDVVRIHTAATASERDVAWVDAETDLDVLRAVAVARILAPRGARVGIDWSRHGLELAQVALGFGASDLRGPITRKSGLPILEHEAKKIKGQGLVELSSVKKREIALLVEHAGRVPVFVGEDGRLLAAPREEVTHA